MLYTLTLSRQKCSRLHHHTSSYPCPPLETPARSQNEPAETVRWHGEVIRIAGMTVSWLSPLSGPSGPLQPSHFDQRGAGGKGRPGQELVGEDQPQIHSRWSQHQRIRLGKVRSEKDRAAHTTGFASLRSLDLTFDPLAGTVPAPETPISPSFPWPGLAGIAARKMARQSRSQFQLFQFTRLSSHAQPVIALLLSTYASSAIIHHELHELCASPAFLLLLPLGLPPAVEVQVPRSAVTAAHSGSFHIPFLASRDPAKCGASVCARLCLWHPATSCDLSSCHLLSTTSRW